MTRPRPTAERVDYLLKADNGRNQGFSDLAAEVRAMRDRYREPPAGMRVREAARNRYALAGADAQALEGALQQVDAEVEQLKAELRGVRASQADSEVLLNERAAEIERLRASNDAYERDNNANIQTIVDLQARLGEPSKWFKTSWELQLRELLKPALAARAYLREERRPGAQYIADELDAVLAKVNL